MCIYIYIHTHVYTYIYIYILEDEARQGGPTHPQTHFQTPP